MLEDGTLLCFLYSIKNNILYSIFWSWFPLPHLLPDLPILSSPIQLHVSFHPIFSGKEANKNNLKKENKKREKNTHTQACTQNIKILKNIKSEPKHTRKDK